MSGKVETRSDMIQASYKFLANSKCKGCDAPIEWWLTTNKHRIPYNPVPASDDELVTPHWATCPKRDEFKAQPRKGSGSASADPLPALRKQIEQLRVGSNARIIVALFDEGSVATWRTGIPAEDLRHELITEANSVRYHIQQGLQKGPKS